MNKTVVITGDTGRLGSVLSSRFLAEGWDVLGISRTPESTNPIYRHIQLNVALYPEETAEKVITEVGVPTLFIHNAGAFLDASIEKTSDEDLARLTNINFVFPFKMLRALIPKYKEAGLLSNAVANRSVLFIGSAAMYQEVSKKDPRDTALYSATKAALASLSGSAAEELKEFGVRINTLAPYYFTGDMEKMERLAELCVQYAHGRESGTVTS